jgi:hypothetical protein
MPTYTLTILDTAGIQGYIFGSNVLRENIGASELVRRATLLWPLQIAREIGASNVKPNPSGSLDDLDDGLHIQRDKLSVEVIYAGGGNCALLFEQAHKARDFVTDLSCRMLAQAPDLDLVAVHLDDIDWDKPVLAGKVQEALAQLAVKKRERRVSVPLLGLGATVSCRSTGLPAVGVDDEGRPLSAGILAKLDVWEAASQRLGDLLPQFGEAGLEIPYDLDNMGREEGEISYIAVVHADGNGMGQRIEKLRQDVGGDNRQYIQAMRDFSRAVETGSHQALDDVSTLLLRHWKPAQGAIVGQARDRWGEFAPVGQVNLGQKKRRRYVPFRPIVFGGDDLTFVTDGRLGLGLAAAYLAAFEKAMNAQDNQYTQDLQACAGVAVVKAHYPFSHAYDLAEDLCRNAKNAWERQHSALDWHFAASGLFGRLSDIRQRHYTVPAGSLELRPLPLQEPPGHWRSWAGFGRVAAEFVIGPDWRGKRNKVIALREALRGGPEAVVQFRRAYGLEKLPPWAGGIGRLQDTGWDGAGRCGYFDAVEALDFFLPLEWKEEAN